MGADTQEAEDEGKQAPNVSTGHPRTHVALIVKLRSTLLLLLDNLQKLSEIWTNTQQTRLHCM